MVYNKIIPKTLTIRFYFVRSLDPNSPDNLDKYNLPRDGGH